MFKKLYTKLEILTEEVVRLSQMVERLRMRIEVLELVNEKATERLELLGEDIDSLEFFGDLSTNKIMNSSNTCAKSIIDDLTIKIENIPSEVTKKFRI